MNSNYYHNLEIGRKFPQVYLETLASQLQTTIDDWLQEQGAPNELRHALESATMLEKYAAWMKNNELPDAMVDDIPEMVARAAQDIRRFGGTFDDERPADVIIKWGVL